MPSEKKLGAYIRPDIESLPAYVPGARPPAGVTMTKLSSNENPADPAPAVVDAVHRAASQINRYPDLYATNFTDAIAEHWKLSPENVAVGNGSVALLWHALTALAVMGDDVVYPWRSFEAYPIIAQAAGATSIQVPLREDASHDLAAMAAAVTERTRAVIVCNPNNPTGNLIARSELMDFIETIPPTVAVFVDEAYQEYVEDAECSFDLSELANYPNVLVFRTFSKAYGLAGLRVGYCLGDPRLIAAVRSTSTPFGVNAIAQAAAQVALGEQEVMRRQVKEAIEERERVVTELREAGWRIPPTSGNFFYLPLREHAAKLAAAGLDEGVLIRGYAGDGVRVTIGTPAENDRLLEFLAAREPNSSALRRP